MYNLRYHIASLVGVFLALALGLVLGGLVVRQGTVERQRTALVEGLQTQFAQIRDDNQRITAENEGLQAFSSEMADAWIAGRLDGMTIVVVMAAGQDDEARDCVKIIESAGGTAVVATVLEPGLALQTDAVRSVLASADAPADDLRSVASALAAEWGFAVRNRPYTAALSEAGVLRIEGLELGTAVSGLVDIAAFEERADEAGIAIATAFGRYSPAIGAQTAKSKADVVNVARQVKLSTLDHLETAAGRYTLVALLSGAKKGAYGNAPDATALFPGLPSR